MRCAGPAGHTERDLEAILVAVGDGPSYGGGLRICPNATLDDGLLDVIVIAAASRRRLLRVHCEPGALTVVA